MVTIRACMCGLILRCLAKVYYFLRSVQEIARIFIFDISAKTLNCRLSGWTRMNLVDRSSTN